METPNIDKLNSFGINNLPNLDVVVLGALELFQQTEIPNIDTSAYKHPLVVGSGNAEATGRIIFEKTGAIFASESNFENKLENINDIDGVIIISASGEKHAPIIAHATRELGKRAMLITNSINSSARKELDTENDDREYVFPKNREPYTYNTSTYMGMILGATGENPAEIERFIHECTEKLDFPDFSNYDKYFLIVPSKFSNVAKMIETKFIELFGRNIARDVVTVENAKHATTVAPSNELFISFGEPNTTWGSPENRFHVPLPDGCDYGAMMAIGYCMVSKIQEAYPHFFKDNIEEYTQEVSKIFGQTIKPIVEK